VGEVGIDGVAGAINGGGRGGGDVGGVGGGEATCTPHRSSGQSSVRVRATNTTSLSRRTYRRCNKPLSCSTRRKKCDSVARHLQSARPRMNGRRNSRYGNGFSRKMAQDTTAVGSRRIMSRSRSVAVSRFGRSVSYMPPGLRKSGMPAPTEIPAPVKHTTRLPARMRPATCAMRVASGESPPTEDMASSSSNGKILQFVQIHLARIAFLQYASRTHVYDCNIAIPAGIVRQNSTRSFAVLEYHGSTMVLEYRYCTAPPH
jgi:hypothetical protein